MPNPGILIGFDPLINEIALLKKSARPNEHHVCAYVVGEKPSTRDHLQSRAFEMTTARAANQQLTQRGSSYIQENFNSGKDVEYTQTETSLDNFFASDEWGDLKPNFLKTDTDGFDFGVLEGAKRVLSSAELIGVEVECLFHGDPSNPRASTFSNIDTFLRSLGFTLYRLEPYTYSRVALPSPFVYDIGAQTSDGTVQWADAVYLRDPFLSQDFRDALDASTNLRRKYLVVLDILGFRDVLAQALTEFPREYFPWVDVEEELNRLAQGNPFGAESYAELIDMFEKDFRNFFPSRLAQKSRSSGRLDDDINARAILRVLRKLIRYPRIRRR
ncbi:FkbM family methyltransferase [Pontimonas sp.]|nr:FkbM family methyltransferase [Pontimonas sp.]